MKKIISTMLVIVVTMNLFSGSVLAESNGSAVKNSDVSILDNTTKDDKNVKLVKVKNKESDLETFMIVITDKEKSVKIKEKSKYVDPNMSVDDIMKNDKKSDYSYSNRVEFGIFSNEAEAMEVFTEFTTSASTGFWHGSYIEDYYSWAGHGYHVHLSARDASYVTNLGWVAVDSIAAALVYIGAVTGGVGIVLGAIATVAVLTLYWAEQNDDGSLDIWSPDAFRGNSALPGASLGTIKIGSHWYPIVMP